ncbi:hypothetical protein OIU79_026138 [Salix purpurea]|uniref:Uncharacterized protein n=1 Tax=Salix purpurea TaxID=77065 RepID=A0A9Q0VTI5_SALPP|nr:hypothetical protein OIU79_026138 [Salix purpurea]
MALRKTGKKNEHSSVLNTPRVEKSEIQNNNKIVEDKEVKKQVVKEGSFVRKEIFVIKHRKSQDRDKRTPPPPSATASASEILLGNSSTNCGRLSRSNSSGSGKPPSGIKYSGSKRSYDFDNNNNNNNNNDQNKDVESATYADHYDFTKKGNDDDDGEDKPREGSIAAAANPASLLLLLLLKGGGGHPARKETRTSSPEAERGAVVAVGEGNRPGKMVSVPATVSSLVVDKSNNGVEPQATTRIKRISVKRNVGDAALTGTGTTSSPRSKSPARTNAKTSNENNQQPSLSRNNSRKADQTPYRRNPLSEIDPNSLKYSQSPGNKATCTSYNRVQIRNNDIDGQVAVKESFNLLNQTPMKKQNSEKNNRVDAQVTNCRGSNIVSLENKISKESQMEEAKGQPTVNHYTRFGS